MNWGNVRMSAPRLWEPDRDGQKPLRFRKNHEGER